LSESTVSHEKKTTPTPSEEESTASIDWRRTQGKGPGGALNHWNAFGRIVAPVKCIGRTYNRAARHPSASREGSNAGRREIEQAGNNFSDDECARLDDICGIYYLVPATGERGSHICKVLDITKRAPVLHPRTAQQRARYPRNPAIPSIKSGWWRNRRNGA